MKLVLLENTGRTFWALSKMACGSRASVGTFLCCKRLRLPGIEDLASEKAALRRLFERWHMVRPSIFQVLLHDLEQEEQSPDQLLSLSNKQDCLKSSEMFRVRIYVPIEIHYGDAMLRCLSAGQLCHGKCCRTDAH